MIPLVNKNAHKRTAEGFKACVDKIGCEPEAVEAVIAVEAAGKGWDRYGRLRMLFEPHVFYREIKQNDPGNLEAAKYYGLAYPKWGQRPYPKDSYPRLESARQLDEELALRAASWGLPQILGENFEAAGYKSATDMVTSFLAGEDEQLTALASFIVTEKLAAPLRAKDWATFARGYNGSGYAKNAYDVKLQAAYGKAKRRTTIGKVATGTATVSTGGAPIGGAGTKAGGGDTTETGAVIVGMIVLGVAAWLFAKWNASREIVSDYKPMPKIDDDGEEHVDVVIEPTEILPPNSLTDIEGKAANVRACQAQLDQAVAEFEDAVRMANERIEADRSALTSFITEVSTIKSVPAPIAPIEPAPAAPAAIGE